jgi:aspartate racemase
VVYYQIINRRVKERLGGVHSARSLMYSVDFDIVARMQQDGDWAGIEKMMVDLAQRLESAGADCVVICANTIHLVADAVERSVGIPLIHIGDATGEAIKKAGMKKVGLLGTKYTMEKAFLKERLLDKFGIETIVPDEADREKVHSVIYNELVKGDIKNESRCIYLEIIDTLTRRGVEGIILGCTEIPLLVSREFTGAILFDTTKVHAEKAVEFALAGA